MSTKKKPKKKPATRVLAQLESFAVSATTGDAAADAALVAVGGIRLSSEQSASFVARMLTHEDTSVRAAAQAVASEVVARTPSRTWTDTELRVAVVRNIEAAADQYVLARGEEHPPGWRIAIEGPLAFWADDVCETVATLAKDPRAAGRIAGQLSRTTAERAVTALADPRRRGAPTALERGRVSVYEAIHAVLRELRIATGNAETVRKFLRDHPARFRQRFRQR